MLWLCACSLEVDWQLTLASEGTLADRTAQLIGECLPFAQPADTKLLKARQHPRSATNAGDQDDRGGLVALQPPLSLSLSQSLSQREG